ncbi:MAG: hypothetical protein AMS15_08300 [Planctomycetes bacterium DG_23]|nr:MAG: hypothetical protein AMS15_08300 [Planctomycetes bacterium DG_23]
MVIFIYLYPTLSGERAGASRTTTSAGCSVSAYTNSKGGKKPFQAGTSALLAFDLLGTIFQKVLKSLPTRFAFIFVDGHLLPPLCVIRKHSKMIASDLL